MLLSFHRATFISHPTLLSLHRATFITHPMLLSFHRATFISQSYFHFTELLSFHRATFISQGATSFDLTISHYLFTLTQSMRKRCILPTPHTYRIKLRNLIAHWYQFRYLSERLPFESPIQSTDNHDLTLVSCIPLYPIN